MRHLRTLALVAVLLAAAATGCGRSGSPPVKGPQPVLPGRE
ncbi:hypothetical protein [Streptomyces sp. ISL-94]|nr:hypothetical protein [Streptomyces sp. ISL-94]